KDGPARMPEAQPWAEPPPRPAPKAFVMPEAEPPPKEGRRPPKKKEAGVAPPPKEEPPAPKKKEPAPGEVGRLTGGAPVAVAAFAPDGRTVATLGKDRVLRLWDVATARERVSLPGQTGAPLFLRYSPDGRWLATGERFSPFVKVREAATGRQHAAYEAA